MRARRLPPWPFECHWSLQQRVHRRCTHGRSLPLITKLSCIMLLLAICAGLSSRTLASPLDLESHLNANTDRTDDTNTYKVKANEPLSKVYKRAQDKKVYDPKISSARFLCATYLAECRERYIRAVPGASEIRSTSPTGRRRSSTSRHTRSQSFYYERVRFEPFDFFCRTPSEAVDDTCISCSFGGVSLFTPVPCSSIKDLLPFAVSAEEMVIIDDYAFPGVDSGTNVVSVPSGKVADVAPGVDNAAVRERKASDFRSHNLRRSPSIPLAIGAAGAIGLVVLGAAMFVIGRGKIRKSGKSGIKSQMDPRLLSLITKAGFIYPPDLTSTGGGGVDSNNYEEPLSYMQSKSFLIVQQNATRRDLFLQKAHLLSELPGDTIHSRTAYLSKSVLDSGQSIRPSEFAMVKERLLQYSRKHGGSSIHQARQTLSMRKADLPKTSNNYMLLKILQHKPLAGSQLKECIYSHDYDSSSEEHPDKVEVEEHGPCGSSIVGNTPGLSVTSPGIIHGLPSLNRRTLQRSKENESTSMSYSNSKLDDYGRMSSSVRLASYLDISDGDLSPFQSLCSENFQSLPSNSYNENPPPLKINMTSSGDLFEDAISESDFNIRTMSPKPVSALSALMKAATPPQ